MPDPICCLCGDPITEDQAEAGDYVDTSTGEVHDRCLEEWENDADGRRADAAYDQRYDR